MKISEYVCKIEFVEVFWIWEELLVVEVIVYYGVCLFFNVGINLDEIEGE